jgi:hypothetical protein
MSNNVKWSPKVNAEIELKKLGTIRGNPIYIDLAGVIDDEQKFQEFLVIQKIMQDFFHPPEDEVTPTTEREEVS